MSECSEYILIQIIPLNLFERESEHRLNDIEAFRSYQEDEEGESVVNSLNNTLDICCRCKEYF
jgi:hypothetical protein